METQNLSGESTHRGVEITHEKIQAATAANKDITLASFLEKNLIEDKSKPWTLKIKGKRIPTELEFWLESEQAMFDELQQKDVERATCPVCYALGSCVHQR
ncbi:MAG: hypothetical protein WC648_04775 [Candidatus Paceibacterota bacterium]|jgi:hypothetical protein